MTIEHMRKTKNFSVTETISFYFEDEGNGIEVRYNMFGFTKIIVNGDLVSSKWSISTRQFALFNIGPDLYSANIRLASSDDEICICMLIKNEIEIQRQKLIFSVPQTTSSGLFLPIIMSVFLFLSFLFATGCFYLDVSRQFYYVFYTTTAFLVLLKLVVHLRSVSFNVVPDQGSLSFKTRLSNTPMKSGTLMYRSSRGVGQATWILIFFVGMFVTTVLAWEINYAGEPIAEFSGTVKRAQWISRGRSGAFLLARVEILPEKTVTAHCPDSRLHQQVVVFKKIAVIFRNTIYQCAKS